MRNPLLAVIMFSFLSGCAGTPAQIFRDTPEQLKTEDTDKLCNAFGIAHTPPIRAELQRRNAIRPQFFNVVQNRKISIGMSDCEVISSWDRPDSINRTVTANGVSEQWVYRNGGFNAQYVYMENGYVTSFQEQE